EPFVLGSAPNPSNVGQLVTLTATVTSSTGVAPGLNDGSTTLAGRNTAAASPRGAPFERAAPLIYWACCCGDRSCCNGLARPNPPVALSERRQLPSGLAGTGNNGDWRALPLSSRWVTPQGAMRYSRRTVP